jgi:hypothetical protein
MKRLEDQAHSMLEPRNLRFTIWQKTTADSHRSGPHFVREYACPSPALLRIVFRNSAFSSVLIWTDLFRQSAGSRGRRSGFAAASACAYRAAHSKRNARDESSWSEAANQTRQTAVTRLRALCEEHWGDLQGLWLRAVDDSSASSQRRGKLPRSRPR